MNAYIDTHNGLDSQVKLHKWKVLTFVLWGKVICVREGLLLFLLHFLLVYSQLILKYILDRQDKFLCVV